MLCGSFWVLGFELRVRGSEVGEKHCQNGKPRNTRTTQKRLPAYFPPAPQSCKDRASRTQWHSVPRDADFALALAGGGHGRFATLTPSGFAMGAYAGCNPLVCFFARGARNPCVKGQRDGRDKGLNSSFIIYSQSSFAAPRYGLMSYCGPSPFSPSRNSEEDMCRAWKRWERSVLWMVARKGMCSRCLALVAFDRIVA